MATRGYDIHSRVFVVFCFLLLCKASVRTKSEHKSLSPVPPSRDAFCLQGTLTHNQTQVETMYIDSAKSVRNGMYILLVSIAESYSIQKLYVKIMSQA